VTPLIQEREVGNMSEVKLKEGMYLYDAIGNRMEIMALKKGYVMFRFKSAHPIVVSEKEFMIRYRNFRITHSN
jgi:hypothetical protein